MEHKDISLFEQQLQERLHTQTVANKEQVSSSLWEEDMLICLSAVAAALHAHDELRFMLRLSQSKKYNHRALYEGILQTYLFAGFPATLEGLSILHEIYGEQGPKAESFDVTVFQQRGTQLCQTIYTSAYDKMRERLSPITPDLDAWMIIEGYGKTLSRDGLPVKIRELVIVSVLAATGWKNQLFSHVRGSMNVGATSEEVISVIENLRVFGDAIAENKLAKALSVVEKVSRTFEAK